MRSGSLTYRDTEKLLVYERLYLLNELQRQLKQEYEDRKRAEENAVATGNSRVRRKG